MNFDDFYKEHYNLACSIARKFVPNNDIEDVTQEIMIRTWKYFHTLEDSRKIFFWFYSIARNCSINYSKSLSIRALSKADEITDDHEIEEYYEDWFDDVRKCLEGVDPLVRDVTLLKIQGYSQKEVSAKLDIKRKQFYDLWAQGKKYLVSELVENT